MFKNEGKRGASIAEYTMAALTESADYAKAAHAFFEEAWSDVDSMAVWKQDGDFTIRTKTVENADGSGIFKLESTDAWRAYPSPPSASGFSK